MGKGKILLAEDEPKLAFSLAMSLKNSGFEVEWAADGKIAQELISKENFQMLILDIQLPYLNGVELCAMFRKTNKQTPVLMLTALGELHDKMLAFDAGADDYLVKPFHFEELFARIQVFMKRTAIETTPDDSIVVADLHINRNEKKAHRAGKHIDLTAREFALLELLALANGRIVSKVEIAEKIWDVTFDTGTNTIEVYISFLRNKIDKPFDKKLIHTKSGFGYFLKDVS